MGLSVGELGNHLLTQRDQPYIIVGDTLQSKCQLLELLEFTRILLEFARKMESHAGLPIGGALQSVSSHIRINRVWLVILLILPNSNS